MAWERDFTVPAPTERAWEVFGDVGVLAECLPGLTGIEAERDGVRARLRFRAGSNQVTYVGTIVPGGRTSDEFTVAATGTEARGDGEVAISVRIRLRDSAPGTSVSLAVTPTGSGRVTGFDASAVQDAGERLLDRFVAAVGERFPEPAELPAQSEPPAESVAEPEPEPPAESVAKPQPPAESVAEPEQWAEPVHAAPVIELPTPAAAGAVAWRARTGAAVAVLLGIVALWFLRRRAES